MTLLALGATARVAAAVHADPHVEVGHGLLAVDQFALFFKVIFLGAAAITVLMSIRYLATEGAASPGEYYFLILCATLGMMIMAGGIDLITIFIGLETMAVSFYILAGYIKPNQRSNEAAVKYFLLGAFSLGILLYGMSLMYGLSGTTNLRVMATTFVGQEQDPRLVLAVILVVAGIGFKIAAVPFHMWAPDVYEGAPTPITAFLSVGSKAASFAMLIRIFVEGLPSMSADWRLLFYVLAILTMTAGNIAAVTQIERQAHARVLVDCARRLPADRHRGRDVARHHRDAHLPVHLRLHAARRLRGHHRCCAGPTCSGDELKDFSGLAFRNPFAAFAMLIFMLSLGGIPPTAGFMGKFWLFSAAIDAHYYWLAVIGVLNSAISLYYYVRIVVFMYLKKETIGSEPTTTPALAVVLAWRWRRRSCSASTRGCCSRWRTCRPGRLAWRVCRRRCAEIGRAPEICEVNFVISTYGDRSTAWPGGEFFTSTVYNGPLSWLSKDRR